jgi:putative oxidoreductase
MKQFPFLSLSVSVSLLRIGIAIIFLTHSLVRLFKGTIPQFGKFLDSKGLLIGEPLVWVITLFEIVGGIMLAFNYKTRWLSAGFIFILVVGILLIHASLGWFVGEHGTGGSEYSFALILALLVLAAYDRETKTSL